MLTVASITARATSVSFSGNWEFKHIHKTVVVCSGNDSSVRGECEVVNVSVVHAAGFASRDVGFALLYGVRCPFKLGGTGHAVRILLFCLNTKEETFVGTIGCSYVCAIYRPVETVDKGRVTRKLAIQSILAFFTNLVNVNFVIVRSNGEVLLVRGIAGNFTPLLGLLKILNFLIKIFDRSY
jgi:hypothetical protein